MYNLLLYKTALLRSLITMLENEGIAITTAAAVDMEKVLARTDLDNTEGISGLKYLLAPLLCRNKEDQDKVYKVFDKLDAKFKEQYIIPVPANQTVNIVPPIKPADKAKPDRKWYLKNLVIPVLVILALIIAAFLLLKPCTQKTNKQESHKINIVATPREVIIGDTVYFKPVFIDSNIDIRNVTVDWKFPDTLISNQLSVSKVIYDSFFDVKAFLKKKNGTFIDSNSYHISTLCELPPSVNIEESDIAEAGSKTSNRKIKQFRPLFTNPSKDSGLYTYKWSVDDSLYSHNKILLYSKSYNKIDLVVDGHGAHCSTPSLIAEIESTPALNVAITGNGNLRIQSTYNWRNFLLSILLLLILPCIIAFIIYRFIRSIKSFTPEIDEEEPGTEGPYKIEFINQQQNINAEEGINKLADVLRKRQVSDIYKLNIRKTIRSTVIAGGIPSLQFTPLSKPLNFLAFIDKENADSHLVKLFEYLVEKLHKEEVNIAVYSYEKEPLFLSNEKLNQENIPLEKIASLYADTTLFIFGNAQYFLYPLKGTTKSWVTKKLNNWPTKFLITPYAAVDWDKKERLLIDSNFVVLPSDISSVQVIDKIISRQIDIAAQKKERLDYSYRSRFINFQDFDTLKNYLGDKYLLQWVCSLAVYTAIDWNFTIAMGKAIEQQLSKNNKAVEVVNYSNLLKIARISWMDDGIINESLRVQMLSYLDKDAEALARETLSRQLQLVESTINKDSLVKTSFDVHTKLNRFLLDAYYHKKTSNADDAFVKKLIESHQLDEGQDIYLTKGENTLLNNPSSKNDTIGIRDYFNAKLLKQKIFGVACGLALLAGLSLLGFSIMQKLKLSDWLSTKPSVQNYTLNIQGNNVNRQLNFDLYYEPTHKYWSSQKINLASTNFSFKYDSVTLKDTLGYGIVQLSTIDGTQITQDSFKLNSSAYTVNISEVAKTPVTIFYRNAAGLALANSIRDNLPLKFSTNIQQSDFGDSIKTSVQYTDNKFEADANSVVSVISALLNRKILLQNSDSVDNFNDLTTTQYPTGNSSTDIVVFINEAIASTSLTINALPQSLNEIWHGGTSNRLLNIDLNIRKVLYYSTGDPKTYGTYSIYQVYLTKPGTYKIITKANGGFNVFFIKNITPASFDFSVCQTIKNKTAEEIKSMDESYCDHFNTMTLYYEKNPDVVFLPVISKYLVNSELAKFNRFVNSIDTTTKKLEVTRVMNSTFTNGAEPYELDRIKDFIPVDDMYDSSTPFDRYYLRFKTVYKPDCSKTFYSIDETQKLASPLIVCKLDLSNSNLSYFPKEIVTFTNLAELNLGITNIPEKDINALQKLLPKCKISYSKANLPTQNANEPPNNNNQLDNNLTELGLITLDEKGGLSSADRQLINSIAKQLATNKQSIVKFDATYTDKQEYSIIYEGLRTITNMLRKEGAATSQIQQSITELKQQQQQQQQSKSPNRNTTINVQGVNFSPDFNSNPKKAN